MLGRGDQVCLGPAIAGDNLAYIFVKSDAEKGYIHTASMSLYIEFTRGYIFYMLEKSNCKEFRQSKDRFKGKGSRFKGQGKRFKVDALVKSRNWYNSLI